jgi:hypothetical protein
LAGDFDGSKPLLCAIIEIYDCGAEGECEKATPGEVDAPRFFKIDFKQTFCKVSIRTRGGARSLRRQTEEWP